MDNTQKPYRKQSPREPAGIPYNYKDLSRQVTLSEDQVQQITSSTTIISQVLSNSLTLSDATPQALGTANPGGSSDASRADHVHDTLNASIGVTFDGAGSALTTDPICDIYVPFNCVIQSCVLLADQAGDVALDIENDAYGSYPPTGGDSIVASAPPTLSSATKSKDTTLTGWTKTLAADSTLRIIISSIATIQRLTLTLKVLRT